MLIFNVATYWGLTTASYNQINALVEKYPDLVVLGFPCNQFGMQEPYANATELFNGIKHVRPGNNFQHKLTQFFQKVDVNGDFEIGLYTYLKGACKPTFTRFSYTSDLFYEPLVVGDIAWNFEKFLIGRDGKPIYRYHPHLTDPDHLDMNQDILSTMSQANPFEPNSRISKTRNLGTHAEESNHGMVTQRAILKGKVIINERPNPL